MGNFTGGWCIRNWTATRVPNIVKAGKVSLIEKLEFMNKLCKDGKSSLDIQICLIREVDGSVRKPLASLQCAWVRKSLARKSF